MGKKNPLFVASIIKVFSFEKQLVNYMKKRAGEGWKPYDIAPHEVRKPKSQRRAWINDAGHVIVDHGGYSTAYRSIEGFRAIEAYSESHWGMNAYDGFDADFVKNVPALIDQLFAKLKIRTKPEYTAEEFARIAKKCSARSFDTTAGLAAVTAY